MNTALTPEKTTAAIAKTARLLMGRDVTVTTQGAKAFIAWDTKGKIKRINLPMVPRNASPEFLAALQGYLDHEVGHAFNTDPVEGRRIEDEAIAKHKLNTQMMRGMANVVEDVRIEACMEKDFPGSPYNLSAVRKYFTSSFTKPMLDEINATRPGDEAAKRGYVIPVYFRARGGQIECQRFMDDNDLWPVMADYDKAFPDLADRLRSLKSTADATKLAIEVLLAGHTTPPMTMDGEDEGEDDAAGGGSDEKSSKSKAKKGGKSEDEEAGEKKKPSKSKKADRKEAEEEEPASDDEDGDGAASEDDQADEEQDGGEQGDKDGEEASEGGASDDGEGGDGEDEGEDDAAGGGSDDGEESDEADGGDVGETTGVASVAQPPPPGFEVDPETLADFDEIMAKVLERDVADMDSADPYHIFTRDFDDISTAPTMDIPDVAEMEERVNTTSGAMRKHLERLMAARSIAVTVPGYRRGRIHPASLHRVMAKDDRVFAKKHEARTKDTAVSLLVDLSRSMRGGIHEPGTGRYISTKMQVALDAAWVFSEVLDRIKVPNEVIGFTTYYSGLAKAIREGKTTQQEVEDYVKAMGCSPSKIRFEPLYMPIFKNYGEAFSTEVRRRLASYCCVGTADNNVDGESVRNAAHRLAMRREKRKVMIVFSDGQPNSSVNASSLARDLKLAVKEVTAAGVETIGVGIGDKSVEHYYPKHVVIHNVSQLSGEVLHQLSALLTS